MQLVTESYEINVASGSRKENFEEDWFLQYGKFKAVVSGAPYVGFVGFNDRHHPVAISLLLQSHVYSAGTGVWEWFYCSPRLKSGLFFKHLGMETVRKGIELGVERLVSYCSTDDKKLMRVNEALGMKPVEIEYHCNIKNMDKRALKRLGLTESKHGIKARP